MQTSFCFPPRIFNFRLRIFGRQLWKIFRITFPESVRFFHEQKFGQKMTFCLWWGSNGESIFIKWMRVVGSSKFIVFQFCQTIEFCQSRSGLMWKFLRAFFVERKRNLNSQVAGWTRIVFKVTKFPSFYSGVKLKYPDLDSLHPLHNCAPRR